MKNSVDVIVPVYNEEEILPEFYARICALELPLNLIFIDNASTDSSVAFLSGLQNVQLIRHKKNEGYGGSILDGIRHSSNSKIIIIDADCEYPPEIIPHLIRGLDTRDVIYTSRFLDSGQNVMPFLKRAGNRIISSLFNALFRQQVTDLYTGCKAINRIALQDIELNRKGFEHVLELAVKLSREGFFIHEIPIQFTPRHTGKAKMKHVNETIKYIYLLLYYYITLR